MLQLSELSISCPRGDVAVPREMWVSRGTAGVLSLSSAQRGEGERGGVGALTDLERDLQLQIRAQNS